MLWKRNDLINEYSPTPHQSPLPVSSMVRNHGPVLFIWTFFAVFSTCLFYNSFHSFVERFWNTYDSVLTFHSFISPPLLAKPFQSTSSVLRFGSCPKHRKQLHISESKYAFCHILADVCGHPGCFSLFSGFPGILSYLYLSAYDIQSKFSVSPTCLQAAWGEKPSQVHLQLPGAYSKTLHQCFIRISRINGIYITRLYGWVTFSFEEIV